MRCQGFDAIFKASNWDFFVLFDRAEKVPLEGTLLCGLWKFRWCPAWSIERENIQRKLLHYQSCAENNRSCDKDASHSPTLKALVGTSTFRHE